MNCKVQDELLTGLVLNMLFYAIFDSRKNFSGNKLYIYILVNCVKFDKCPLCNLYSKIRIMNATLTIPPKMC